MQMLRENCKNDEKANKRRRKVRAKCGKIISKCSWCNCKHAKILRRKYRKQEVKKKIINKLKKNLNEVKKLKR